MVVVNAATRHGLEWSRREAIPGVTSAFDQIADDLGGRLDTQSLQLLRPALRRWRSAGRPGERDYYLITVSFDSLPDAAERRFFQELPTNFCLSGPTVDRLVVAAGQILNASPEYKRLLNDLRSNP